MKIFLADFTTQKNRIDGVQPLWILRLTISGVDYWLCDNSITIPTFTSASPWPSGLVVNTVVWVKSWGTIQEGISGTLGEFHVADFSSETLIDPSASPNMETLATSTTLEQNPVELYEWFVGCSDPPQRIFRGRIRDIDNLTDTSVNLSIQDESILLEKCYIGRKASQTNYPQAASTDVGKVIPIPFGLVTKAPALALAGCLQTILTVACGAGDTSLYLTDTSYVTAGMVMLIEAEQVYISSVGTYTVTVSRGYASTAAAAHTKGSAVVQLTTQVYSSSDRAISNINRVWLRLSDELDLDITAYCDRYTGQSGNQLSGYGSMAVVAIPPACMSSILDIIQLRQQDTIGVNDTIGVDTGSHAHTETSPLSVINNQVGSVVAANGQTLLASFSSYLPDGAVFIRSTWSCLVQVGSGGAGGNVNGIAITVGVGQSQTISGVSTNSAAVGIHANNPQSLTMSNAVRTVDYTLSVQSNASPAAGVAKTGTVAKTGSAQMTGSAMTSYFGSGKVFADITADSGSLTEICSWVLSQAGFPSTQMIGALPASYATMAGLISEYQTALYWLNLLAFQAGCWFAESNGVSKLIVRPVTGSVKNIPAVIISDDGRRQLTRKKTDFSDLITTVTVLYGRDWSKSKSDIAYKKSYLVPGATGTDERPELFQFDFVTSDAMAASIGAFYLSWYSVRHWLAEFSVPLQHSELEFGDPVTLGFLSGQPATITAAEHAPGSYDTADTIKLTALY